ncbi:MAG: LysR family transcriptional regulator [Deltaproteobacteria bacterium]|nr:LysR family transcriptional regulator [Deltaproteobacteria bacterium]
MSDGERSRSIADLRLADVMTFLAVRRTGTVTGAARELDVTPSQVSKAVHRLEKQLRTALFTRSSRGVAVSEQAARLVPHLEEMVTQLRHLERPRGENTRELALAAPSYLASFFLPVVARSQPQLRLRALQLAPAIVRAMAGEALFEAALTVGPERFPRSWVTTRLGEIRRGLYASPATARKLGKTPLTLDRLRNIPFISPVVHDSGQMVPVDDGCPLQPGERTLGHEVATIGLGLELAACSEQVVFGPMIAAAGHLEAGTLELLEVTGWDVHEPLFFACNGDRVLARDQRALIDAMRGALDSAQKL